MRYLDCPSCGRDWDAHSEPEAQECYRAWLSPRPVTVSHRPVDASPAWLLTYREPVAA